MDEEQNTESNFIVEELSSQILNKTNPKVFKDQNLKKEVENGYNN